MANIKIHYDGKWPNYCRGNLTVLVDDKKYDFGKALISGGSVGFADDYASSFITKGSWRIKEESYPKDFPEELKEELLKVINEELNPGCCGGCL